MYPIILCDRNETPKDGWTPTIRLWRSHRHRVYLCRAPHIYTGQDTCLDSAGVPCWFANAPCRTGWCEDEGRRHRLIIETSLCCRAGCVCVCVFTCVRAHALVWVYAPCIECLAFALLPSERSGVTSGDLCVAGTYAVGFRDMSVLLGGQNIKVAQQSYIPRNAVSAP